MGSRKHDGCTGTRWTCDAGRDLDGRRFPSSSSLWWCAVHPCTHAAAAHWRPPERTGGRCTIPTVAAAAALFGFPTRPPTRLPPPRTRLPASAWRQCVRQPSTECHATLPSPSSSQSHHQAGSSWLFLPSAMSRHQKGGGPRRAGGVIPSDPEPPPKDIAYYPAQHR